MTDKTISASRRFSGTSVLITGACGGLGRQIAMDFAAAGARLTLCDLSADALDAFAAQLRAQGVDVAVCAGDLTQESASQAMVDLAVGTFGALDVAVNNAGIASRFAKLGETETETAQALLSVNVMGVFWAMKYQVLAMEAAFDASGRRASIVNMASVAGLKAAPNLSLYSASKHAVVGMTRSAALEYARRGIRINAVCPSFTRTPMLDDIRKTNDATDDAFEMDMARGIPMRRIATPQEVATAVMFAADPDNSFMTGEMLGVDGGLGAM